MIFQWFLIKNELWQPKKSWFFHFSFIYKQKMKKIMIFCDDSFFQFWVQLDPISIKISRFHALQQEKLVTKVISSLSWTRYGRNNCVMNVSVWWAWKSLWTYWQSCDGWSADGRPRRCLGCWCSWRGKKSEFRKKIQIFMKEMVNETKNSIFSWFSMDRSSKINQKKLKP